jgi:hypothetical protein
VGPKTGLNGDEGKKSAYLEQVKSKGDDLEGGHVSRVGEMRNVYKILVG